MASHFMSPVRAVGGGGVTKQVQEAERKRHVLEALSEVFAHTLCFPTLRVVVEGLLRLPVTQDIVLGSLAARDGRLWLCLCLCLAAVQAHKAVAAQMEGVSDSV